MKYLIQQYVLSLTGQTVTELIRDDGTTPWTIPFDPANTDYQNFKQQINDDSAVLYFDGTLMSPEAAKAYVATLP